MGKKVCENTDSKRELLYSFSTLVFIPLLYYFAVTSAFSEHPPGASGPDSNGESGGESSTLADHEETQGNVSLEGKSGPVIAYIVERRELPFETVLSVVLIEFAKLLVVFILFPGSHLFDQTPSLGTVWNLPSLGSGAKSQVRLPFSRRDKEGVLAKSPSIQTKVLEIWKGLCNYVVGCVICHVFMVLLGAPIIEDSKVTFQFSIILTTWLLSPLCLAVQPSRLLQELLFISLWNSENEVLYRTKWRFAITVSGAWVGAVAIPLDWDRPWQKWPIPCLASSTFTFFVSNLVLFVHLFCTIFGVYHRLYMLTTESSKIKNF